MKRLELRPSLGVLAAIFIPPALVLLVVAVVVAVAEIDVGLVFRDPSAVLDGHPLTGFMSSLGIILWWVTASVCLFTFALSAPAGLSRTVRVFLLTSGLFTVLLAVDDQFLFHDDLSSRYLGLREREVMAGYLVIAAVYVLVNRAVIRRSEWLILIASLAFFAGSIGFDYLTQLALGGEDSIGVGLDWSLLIEDGMKFIGIVGWSAYLLRFSYFALTRRPQEHEPVPAPEGA